MADNLGNIGINSYRYAASGQWDNGSYESLAASYAGTSSSNIYITVDKITLPTISSKYGAPYTLSYRVSLLVGYSGAPTSGTLYAYLCSSDPAGSAYASCSSTSPSSSIASGTASYSGLKQGHSYWTVNIPVNTALTSGGTYYLWIYTSSFTQVHYGGSSYVSGTLSGTVKTYTQSFYPNGAASGSTVTGTKTHDSTYYLLSSMPSSWSKKSSVTSNYTVTLNGNGGSSPASKTSTKTTSYTLGGWREGSTSGTVRSLGYGYATNAAQKWYASWNGSDSWNSIVLGSTSRSNTTSTGYTVQFNNNGGTTTPSSKTATNTTRYSFSSWNTASNGSGTSYNSTSSYTFTGSTTLYAQWTSSLSRGSITLPAAINRNSSSTSYTITFNENFSGGGTSNQTSTKTISYSFAGWNTNSSGTGSNYSANSSYTPSSSHTLYAKWTSSTSQNSITLPSPSRTGYKFLGWGTSASATSPSYSGGSAITPTGNMSLYAIWGATTQTYIYHNGKWMQALKYVWNLNT